VLIPNITISAFVFPGVSLLGFTIPQVHFNTFFAYVFCAIVISCFTKSILWLFD
jgi:H+/Cl- antiporter ClcA